MCLSPPVMRFAEAIGKSVGSPDPVAEIIIEMSQGLHAVFGSVGEGRKGSGRLDHAPVLLRAMRHVPFITVAGCEAPAVGSVAFVFFRIVDAPGPVDQGMVAGLFGVVD